MTRQGSSTKFYIENIPRYIKMRFRKHCIKRCVTMRETIIEIMEKKLREMPDKKEIDERPPRADDVASLFLDDVPRDTIAFFKAKCIENQITMQEAFTYFMRQMTKGKAKK